jgi:high affinity sulfate transporter 1
VSSNKPKTLSSYLPITAWLPACSAETIRADVLAGIALAALLIPEGMAYAGIAGVPPYAGLFAAAVGLLVYALLGSSRHLAVSPTSGSAAMLAALVGPLAGGDALTYMQMASAAAISVGALLLIGGIFKLGFVSEFIAKPVLKGFVFGLALTIMLRQAPKLFGVEKTKGNFFEQLWGLIQSLNHTHFLTLAVGAAALAVTFGISAIAPRVPSALVVFVGGILAVRVFGLADRGVEVVGRMPGGMPHFVLPKIGADNWAELLSGAVGIVLILYAEALAAARTFAAKYNYDVNPNQELKALGTANIASGLLQGFVVGGGMSGTAANASGGARTQLSTMVTSVLTLLTLGFLMPMFRNLPEAVLAAIVIHAVAHLADVGELKRYARLKTGGIWVAFTALIGVLAFGILNGLVLAVCLTLIALMKKLSAPQEAVLGRLHGTGTFVDIKRNPEAELIPGLLIFRPNAILFFANANRVMNHIRELVKQSPPQLRVIILNLEAASEVDVTSLDLLDQLRSDLHTMGIQLYLARVAEPVKDLFARSGFTERLGADRIFWGVDMAVETYLNSIAQSSEQFANTPTRPSAELSS